MKKLMILCTMIFVLLWGTPVLACEDDYGEHELLETTMNGSPLRFDPSFKEPKYFTCSEGVVLIKRDILIDLWTIWYLVKPVSEVEDMWFYVPSGYVQVYEENDCIFNETTNYDDFTVDKDLSKKWAQNIQW